MNQYRPQNAVTTSRRDYSSKDNATIPRTVAKKHRRIDYTTDWDAAITTNGNAAISKTLAQTI